MGNSLMKNDTDLFQETHHDSTTNVITGVQKSDGVRLSSATNWAEFKSSIDDATGLSTDCSTISTTGYESMSANDRVVIGLSRPTLCTDMSYDIPLDLQTMIEAQTTAKAAEFVYGGAHKNNKVPKIEARLQDSEKLYSSTESEGTIFAELTFNEPCIDKRKSFCNSKSSSSGGEFKFSRNDSHSNFIVQHRLQNLKDLKHENRSLKMRDKVKKSDGKLHKLSVKAGPFSDDALCLKESQLAHVAREVVVLQTSKQRGGPKIPQDKLYSLRLARVLNLWALYPAVFDVNVPNVILNSGEFVDKLAVKQFLVKPCCRYLWTSLNDVEFVLAVENINGLQYVAKMGKKQLVHLLELIQDMAGCRVELPSSNSQGKRPGRCDRIAVVSPYEVKRDREEIAAAPKYETVVRKDSAPRLNSLGCVPFSKAAFQLKVKSDGVMNCSENVSEAGPTTAANIDNLNSNPLLNDSSDLEFISRIGGTGLVAENLRKQSLYVKFDPLVANEVNNSSMNGDTTLTNDICNLSLNEVSRETSFRQSNDDRHNSSTEVTDSKELIGKLISVTPNKSPRKKKSQIDVANKQIGVRESPTPKSSPRFPDTDSDDLSELKSLLLKQMKREEAFKDEIDSVRRDHEQTLMKLQNAEKEMGELRKAMETVQENERKLKNELKERIKNKQQLSIIMEEYEKTISQMVTRKEEERKEFENTVRKLETDRDSAMQHLNNLENAFNDVHQKYERGKLVNEALKKNEDILKRSLSEYEVTVKTVENKYELLKSHATSQLEKANQELELITQTYEKEQAKLKAMLRKSEIQINSLQNALDQKTKENQELTAVCDELIVKLSTHSNM